MSGGVTDLSPWLALAGFGAYHGLNPGMGWLFAVALGLQQQSGRAILAALLPIALGHAASLGLVAVVLGGAGAFLPLIALRWLTAAGLLAFGLYKLSTYYRHPRWVGMRVSARQLCGWSCLMATAHGAGLMVAPLLLAMPAGEHSHAVFGTPVAPAAWAMGIGIHTLVMLLTMAGVAWLVYRRLGLAVLRRGWINFDLIWAIALLVVGTLALLSEMYPRA